jgi:small-conductance mechanosensitive channel/CRP-like cAMP-binding protein
VTPEIAWAAGLFVAIILTAVAINRFAPAARSRLRVIVIEFVLYALALALVQVLKTFDEPVWANRLEIATEVLRVLAVVSLAGMIVFRLILNGLGIALPTIASDLLVGIGYVVATIGVFSQHGLDPVGALATGAVLSAVLAISLQTTLGNILGGVALQLDGSIHEGDWIQLENGKQGRIRAIRWRHTLVETRDWSTIVVPNAQLLQNNITILGWRDGALATQRMWVWFNVDFRYPPQRVIDVVTEGLLATQIENVAGDPKPNCVCMDFAKDGRDSFASYAVRYWIIDLANDDPTNSRVRSRIFTALKRAGIPLATPAVTNLVEIHDREREKSHVERDVERRVAALKNVNLFKPLTEQELRAIAEGLSPVIYSAGERITSQGAVAHYLYILVRGRVEISTRRLEDPESEPHVVAKLDAPEVFGEMGLMTGAPRGADVIARTDAECLRLGKPAFEHVLKERPEVAAQFAELLAARRMDDEKKENDDVRRTRHKRETERILDGIKSFFGL